MNPSENKRGIGQEDYARKLFLMRDVEGGFNYDALDAAKSADRELSEYPTYVGVALWGSSTKGYASKSGDVPSDIDMLLLYDISSAVPDSRFLNPEESLLKRGEELGREL